MTAREQRIHALRREAWELQQRADVLHREARDLSLEQDREDYPCACVRLNRDIGVFDMTRQMRDGRVPLGAHAGAFVSETLTARRDCEACGGEGKPRTETLKGEIA
jgi:hypothetical protein